MKIINKVTEKGYIQWIEDFVKRVLDKTNLEFKDVVIEDIEWSKRVFLEIDGEDYDIRTWNFNPVEQDSNGNTCAEMVGYTLFKTIWDGNGGGHGEEVDSGELKIEWKN